MKYPAEVPTESVKKASKTTPEYGPKFKGRQLNFYGEATLPHERKRVPHEPPIFDYSRYSDFDVLPMFSERN